MNIFLLLHGKNDLTERSKILAGSEK